MITRVTGVTGASVTVRDGRAKAVVLASPESDPSRTPTEVIWDLTVYHTKTTRLYPRLVRL